MISTCGNPRTTARKQPEGAAVRSVIGSSNGRAKASSPGKRGGFVRGGKASASRGAFMRFYMKRLERVWTFGDMQSRQAVQLFFPQFVKGEGSQLQMNFEA